MSAALDLAAFLDAGGRLQPLPSGRHRLVAPRPGLLRPEHTVALRVLKPALALLWAQRWRACLLAWPGADRSGWWFRYQHHQAAGLSAPRAQRRAFLEVCEVRLALGLDVDEPAPHPAERLDLPPCCQAGYFEEGPCTCSSSPLRPCPGVVNRERDQLGGDRLPAELRPAPSEPSAYPAPWEVPGPLPPSAVPFHLRPEVVSDVWACRACGARTVEALPGRYWAQRCTRCGATPPVEGMVVVPDAIEDAADLPPVAYLSERSREVLGWFEGLLGARVVEIRSRSDPEDGQEDAPEGEQPALTLGGYPEPRRRGYLAPFDWVSAVPLPPVPPPAPPGGRLLHPLDGPPVPRSQG